MGLVLDEDQEQFAKSVRQFFEDQSPVTAARQLMDEPAGRDGAVWARMARELGLHGLSIPERFGGAGSNYQYQAIVFEQMGRALLVAPYFSTVALAANALILSGDDEAGQRYLPAIADGSLIATLAYVEDRGHWDLSEISTRATTGADGYSLEGHKSFVIDGADAALILVVAAAEGGPSLFAVDVTAGHLTCSRLETLDLTRRQARIEFSGTPARLVGRLGEAADVVTRTLDLAAVALAAEQVGGAQRCLEMSVEYAKVRSQFGRKIGSFQAIKHKCADMLIAVESARSAASFAAVSASGPAADLAVAAPMAQAVCSDAFAYVATENIQVHGGIGFTWEHDAHLFYRRAQSSALMLGDAAYHRELLARRLGF